MYQKELETLLGYKLSVEDYEAAEVVYLYHPICGDKEDIARLWKMGGRAFIEELKPLAIKIKEAEERCAGLRTDLANVEQWLKATINSYNNKSED